MNALRVLVGLGRPTPFQAAVAIDEARQLPVTWADGPHVLIIPVPGVGLAWGLFGITLDDGENIETPEALITH